MNRSRNALRPLCSATSCARAAMAALAAVVLAGLSACGGPTRAVENFKPTRVVVLGDELSRIEADGRRYGINGLEADGATVACASQPLWTQAVATAFGLSVCPATAQNAASVMLAQVGAGAAGLQSQVDAIPAAQPLGAADLVTVLVGYNDVRGLHSQRGAVAAVTLLAQADAAGRAAAVQVCRVLSSGARVVVSTVPDLGQSPLGRSQADGGALLTQLTDEFNKGLRLAIGECRVDGDRVDGWRWGLLLGDEKTRQAASLTPLANITTAACLETSPPPACTTATLKPGATAAAWLWATDTLPSPAWHSLVGASVNSLAFYPI